MIFYFTGTGNSLWIAKQIEENPVSIPQIIKQENQIYSDKKIGIVAPVYGHEMPKMVKEFIKLATFKTDYFYIILTYGNRHGGAVELANDFCKENNIHVDYLNIIEMVDNWLPSFDMDEQKKIDKHVDEYLKGIIADINSLKKEIPAVTEADRQAHKQYLENMSKLPKTLLENIYTVNENCVQCAVCTKVCPAGCIRLENSKVVYDMKKCELCMACIHNCPQKAIKLNVPEKNPNARYRNINVKLEEIIEANMQND